MLPSILTGVSVLLPSLGRLLFIRPSKFKVRLYNISNRVILNSSLCGYILKTQFMHQVLIDDMNPVVVVDFVVVLGPGYPRSIPASGVLRHRTRWF